MGREGTGGVGWQGGGWIAGVAGQMRAEIWGLLVPGNPVLAADYAARDAGVRKAGTVGCLMGLRNGLRGIPAAWKDPLQDRYELQVTGLPREWSIADLARQVVETGESLLVSPREGGKRARGAVVRSEPVSTTCHAPHPRSSHVTEIDPRTRRSLAGQACKGNVIVSSASETRRYETSGPLGIGHSAGTAGGGAGRPHRP